MAARLSLSSQGIGRVMSAIGRSFIGSPYAAGTLESEGRERLVVNLQEFDCVTLVENIIALARCICLRRETFDAFTEELTRIRYRSGTINGYASRLHYFIDWIDDNERKGIVRNVTRELGGVAYTKQINFMSRHRSSYRQCADPSTLNTLVFVEKDLGSREHYYIPKKKLPSNPETLKEGDILAITTSLDGLDVSHVGLAVQVGNTKHYLHASLRGGVVSITEKPVREYIASHPVHTGIMVARALLPHERE